MEARMATTKPRHVPGHGVRVTLTRELPMAALDRYPYFVGDLDGTPIRYHCLAVESVVGIRRGLAECGVVIHDAPSSWLDLATGAERAAAQPDETPIPLSRDERVALKALRLLTDRGVIQASDGIAE